MPEDRYLIDTPTGQIAGKDALVRFAELQSLRTTTETTWQEIADNLLGRRDFISYETPGRERQARIYDSVGQIAADTLAGALHSLLTNPAQKWFSLQVDADLMEEEGVASWLDDTRDRILNEMGPKSGFTTNMAEDYLDLVGFGTSAMWISERPGGGLIFSARPLREVFIDEDSMGRIDTVYRAMSLTPRQIVTMFGAKAPARYQSLVSAGKGGGFLDRFTILQAIEQNPGFEEGRLGPRGMAWRTAFVDSKSAEVIQSGGYFELPLLVSRWSKDSGEVYGRGPGHLALSDQRMANEAMKTMLVTAQKSANPPLLVPNEGILNRTRTVPGAQNVYRSRSFRESPIFELPHGNYQIASEVTQRIDTRVEMAFKREIVKAFEDPRMTATQVAELAQLSQRQLSPVLGRMQTEKLEPIVARSYSILARGGRFLPPPDSIAGQELRVEYVSPVQRAQKEGEARAVVELMTIILNMAQGEPDAAAVVNWEESIRFLAEAKSVPAKLLRTKREFKSYIEAQRQVADDQAELDQVSQVAKAAGQASPALQAASQSAQASV